jgi:hypothetical protein
MFRACSAARRSRSALRALSCWSLWSFSSFSELGGEPGDLGVEVVKAHHLVAGGGVEAEELRAAFLDLQEPVDGLKDRAVVLQRFVVDRDEPAVGHGDVPALQDGEGLLGEVVELDERDLPGLVGTFGPGGGEGTLERLVRAGLVGVAELGGDLPERQAAGAEAGDFGVALGDLDARANLPRPVRADMSSPPVRHGGLWLLAGIGLSPGESGACTDR